MSSLILGLIIPLLAPLIIIEKPESFVFTFEDLTTINSITVINQKNEINWHEISMSAGKLIYLLGVSFMLLRLVTGLGKIYQLYKNAEKVKQHGFIFAYNEKPHLPFSFLNIIFLSKGVDFGEKLNKVIVHEITHVKQWHSLDVLITEVLQVFFWFNPVLIFYKKSLKDAHEYLADQTVVTQSDYKSYVHLLMHTSSNSLEGHLVNSFFNSQIKNRIAMLSTKHSNPRATLRYIILIPMIGLFTYLLASNKYVGKFYEDSISAITNDTITPPQFKKQETAGNRDSYPVGKWKNGKLRMGDYTYDILNYDAQEDFNLDEWEIIAVNHPGKKHYDIHLQSLKKDFVKGIGRNLKLPGIYREQPKEYIWKDSKLTFMDLEYTIVNKVVNGTFDLSEWITNSKYDQKNSKVEITLLEKKANLTESNILPPAPPPPPPPSAPKEIFRIVEEMPRFPGCEDLKGTIKEKEDCAKEKLLMFLGSNVKYPKIARENGIEGQAVIQFTVTKMGDIEDVVVLRDPGAGMGEASKVVVEAMNTMPLKWTPGRQKGVPVNVQYTVPLKFKLNNDTSPINKENQSPAQFSNVPPPPPPPPPPPFKAEIFKIVEEMPRFPGCEDAKLSDGAKLECAKGKLMQYIGTHINYNAKARENGVEGVAVVQFTITKKGDIKDVVILRDPGNGLGDDAKKVISSMNEMPSKWIPGRQRGVAVDVQYTVPVKFKLNGSNKTNDEKAGEKQIVVVGYRPEKNNEKTEQDNKETFAKPTLADGIGLKPLIIVDGKKVADNQMKNINPSDIVSINVHKTRQELLKYTNQPDLYGGLVVVTTKNVTKVQEKRAVGKYFVDGKLSDQNTVNTLKPDEIEIMEVVKGKGKNDGTVLIRTKGSVSNGNLSLSVVPNPAPRDRLSVNIQSKSDQAPVALKVYDTAGKLLHSQTVEMTNGKGSTEINLSSKSVISAQVLIVAEQGKHADVVKAILNN